MNGESLPPPWIVKLNRAREVLQELKSEVGDFLATKPAEVIAVPLDDGRTFDVFLTVHRQPPPRWSTLTGDIIHNAHSALDSLMYRIITRRAAATSTAINERAIYFPITRSAEALRSGTWHQGMGDETLFVVLDLLQPYAYLDEADLSEDELAVAVSNHALTRLRNLSIVDKHRSIHVAVCALDVVWVGSPEGMIPDWRWNPERPWDEKAPMARVTVPEPHPVADVHFGDQFTVALEEEAEPLNPTDLCGLLDQILSNATYTALSLADKVLGDNTR